MLDEIEKAGYIFIFEKDRHGKYLGCNEPFAAAAGLDSPAQIVGKTDAELFWREQAEFFRSGDKRVLKGAQMLNTPEVQMQPGGIAQIVTTKLAKADGNGVVGSFIDMTGYILVKKSGAFDTNGQRFYLGEALGNEYFTKREFDVFKMILLGFPPALIGEKLGLSYPTVNWYTEKIKKKLQCDHRTQLLTTALRFGLTHILY